MKNSLKNIIVLLLREYEVDISKFNDYFLSKSLEKKLTGFTSSNLRTPRLFILDFTINFLNLRTIELTERNFSELAFQDKLNHF